MRLSERPILEERRPVQLGMRCGPRRWGVHKVEVTDVGAYLHFELGWCLMEQTSAVGWGHGVFVADEDPHRRSDRGQGPRRLEPPHGRRKQNEPADSRLVWNSDGLAVAPPRDGARETQRGPPADRVPHGRHRKLLPGSLCQRVSMLIGLATICSVVTVRGSNRSQRGARTFGAGAGGDPLPLAFRANRVVVRHGGR